jgi:Cu/Ag efflux pump CusA
VVIERPPTLGQTVDPQDTIATIMDLRTVWMQVDVYERDLAQRLPIDAVPDVTNVQVQILTDSPGSGRSRSSGS